MRFSIFVLMIRLAHTSPAMLHAPMTIPGSELLQVEQNIG